MPATMQTSSRPLRAIPPETVLHAREVAKTGGLVALFAALVFVCLTTLLAVLSFGGAVSQAEALLRGAMSLCLVAFFIGSHVWMLAPFSFKPETSRRRRARIRALSLTVPEVAALLREVEDQRRPLLRGEVDAVLRSFRVAPATSSRRMRRAHTSV